MRRLTEIQIVVNGGEVVHTANFNGALAFDKEEISENFRDAVQVLYDAVKEADFARLDGKRPEKCPVCKETTIEAGNADRAVQSWQEEPRLNLVIQPLDEEPDVQVEATKVFLHLHEDDMDPIEEELLAVSSRRLALILHGYYREEIDLQDLPGSNYEITIQWQHMPLKIDTFLVTARSEEEAKDLARAQCLEKNKHSGLVVAINGIPVEDN